MATPTVNRVEPILGEGVIEALQKYDCVEEFWERIALARECMPEMHGLAVVLVQDPDEEGREWARITASQPAATPWQECSALSNRYIDEVVKRQYPCRFPFSFVLQVVPEQR